MLEKGIYTEETVGDLDAAIKIYRQIVEDAKAARKYAAQAQYRLGMCYLKKGDKAKAQQELRELLATYPQEKGIAAQTKKDLAKLSPPLGTVTFGPVIERTINDPGGGQGHEGLDIQSGRQFDVPKEERKWWSTAQRLQWIMANGIDLFAENGDDRALIVFNLKLEAVHNRRWDDIRPEYLQTLTASENTKTEMIEGNGYRTYPIHESAKPPLTFALKTTNGELGVLQIVEFVDKPKGIKIRYKLLEYGAAPAASDAPRVIKATPEAFANDVDPSLDKITVTFDRPMTDRSWSWTGGGETFPQRVGEISYDAGRTTCTMPVKLQPGKVYWVGINSPSHRNFKTADGTPAARYVILFATRSADGKPTPLPADLVKQARQINQARTLYILASVGMTESLVPLLLSAEQQAVGFVNNLQRGQIDEAYKKTTEEYRQYHKGLKDFADAMDLSKAKVSQTLGSESAACLVLSPITVKKDGRTLSLGIGMIRFGRGYLIRDLDILPDAKAVEKFVAGFKEANPNFAGPASSQAGASELARDDGTSAGKRSIAGAAEGVKFQALSDGAKLTGVRLYGSRYGTSQPPAESFRVWVTDAANKKIAESSFPYSMFERDQPAWVELPVKPTAVPKDFFVFVDFDAQRTKGVYVHYDAAADGNSFTADRSGKVTPFRDGDWMIRAVMTSPKRGGGNAADEALKGKLITWVEKFFSENYRDITARKTLEWGEPETTPAGNLAIRYKYLATIWNKDKQIIEQRFTFTPEGKYVSAETIEKGPIPREAAPAPRVVKTSPRGFAANIDPSLDKITVTFDRPMMDKNWSFTAGDKAFSEKTGTIFPERVGEISYDAARTTCTMPVKLQPGKVYWVGINSDRHRNFMSADGIPATQYVILFATRTADGKPTPLPTELLPQPVDPNGVVSTRPTDADKKAAENLSAEGWRLWGQRKLPEAEAKFQAAVAKDPANANAFNGLGWSQLNQGKPANAKDAFEKAVKLNPKLAGALNGLGWIAKGQGKTDEAMRFWQQAVEALPSATAALSGLASTLYEQGQYEKALEHYQAMLKIEPDSAEAKAGLAKAQTAHKAAADAAPVAQAWLTLVDEGKISESWEQASKLFQAGVAKDKWSAVLKSAREPLGKLQSRKLISATYMTSVPGAPDGQYLVVQFEAVFENKKQAVETVTPMMDKDGKWRVSGYYVK